jgi:hypothetical protein
LNLERAAVERFSLLPPLQAFEDGGERRRVGRDGKVVVTVRYPEVEAASGDRLRARVLTARVRETAEIVEQRRVEVGRLVLEPFGDGKSARIRRLRFVETSGELARDAEPVQSDCRVERIMTERGGIIGRLGAEQLDRLVVAARFDEVPGGIG